MTFNQPDGSNNAESIPGSAGTDHIRALGGADTVISDRGNDSIEGGAAVQIAVLNGAAALAAADIELI